MYIRKVISFEGSWTQLDKHISQFNDIKSFISQVTLENIRKTPDRFRNEINDEINPRKLFGCWEEIIKNSEWVSSRSYLADDRNNRKYYGYLGDCLKDISVRFITHRDLVNRWLFSTTPIAYKNSVINIPVAVMLTTDAEEAIHGDKRRSMMSANFEKTVEELQALAPLSQSHPFVIIGVSFDDGALEVIDIESELGIAEKQVVINRSIEFPPEFHSAGIGILSYFGTVLREKYPDQEAKVKIEQDGHMVRMVIETEDGNKEIIEKALQEYELVVTGEKPPEAFYDNALKVIELKTELRVAYTKIEAQRDLLIHKGQELSTLKSLFENSLSRPNEQPLSLNFSPVINVTTTQTNTTVINNDILDVADEIKSLISKSGDDSGTELRLLDLNSSIENIDATSSPEEVKNSVGLTKLKRLIDDALNTGSDLNDFFEKISGGVDKLKGLAFKYNSIAEWCGAPQIPSAFLK
ncbi:MULTISPECIES: hypothetical protein [unclassified Pseudoalteromonas]|uniref:hypothetical protein n=1 Tax=unclassified Pseudoalteromonas TaxID=194690 RepID=UPI0025B3B126|nr:MULTISPECIES: hypothetical protein [unclassified Pseudoalteromonas]MDN3377493.1 hypothetical protein [Pseudoalteromonas sp. APC 3893]MDN3385340.1 hypothetical protein [Pseudoalteromonas sp. APC 4017]